jgi:hypothetical protein
LAENGPAASEIERLLFYTVAVLNPPNELH